MSLQIRQAQPEDSGLILNFIRELAQYEHASDQVSATEQMIRDSIFAVDSTTHALICERSGQPIGFAVYFFNYSTWLGKHGLYLEDLYITPAARGSGAGKALLRQLAKIALAQGCGRFEWSVLDWNQPAIDFYRTLGAEPQPEWIGYRLSGKQIRVLAESEESENP